MIRNNKMIRVNYKKRKTCKKRKKFKIKSLLIISIKKMLINRMFLKIGN
jgi:hypothetical protein